MVYEPPQFLLRLWLSIQGRRMEEF